MRETKFRGFHVAPEYLGQDAKTEWVYGDFYLGLGGKHVIRDRGGYDHFYVAPESVGFFTGLKDKNKKEIFEDDFIRVWDTNRWCICDEWEDCCGEDDDIHHKHGEHEHKIYLDCEKFICTQRVVWSEYAGYFCDKEIGDFCPPLGEDFFEFEIIGNFYQNPELLKV